MLRVARGCSFDEVCPFQHQPIPAKPVQLERYDCDYKCNGTANLFIFLEVHRPWRKVKSQTTAPRSTSPPGMRELADVHFPKAERIRVVLENPSTHSARALYQAFPPAEARCLLRRLEFHCVPKHARSRSMCCAANAWTGASTANSASHQRSLLGSDNAMPRALASNGWFTTDKARAKMGRAYPLAASANTPAVKES